MNASREPSSNHIPSASRRSAPNSFTKPQRKRQPPTRSKRSRSTPAQASPSTSTTRASSAYACPPSTPPQALDNAPFALDLFERPQHSLVSDAFKVTSRLFDALINNRAGVCDAHLHPKDNICIAVSRSILTALNSFLVDYACPNSNTTTNCCATHVKQLPVSSHQLRHILEFAYTNDCEFIRNVRSAVLWRKDTDISPKAVVEVIQLAHAAHICHTPDLCTWSAKTALDMVHQRPSFLCSAMSTIMNFRFPKAELLIAEWISQVFKNPPYFLGTMPKAPTPLDAHSSPEALSCPVLSLDVRAFDSILRSGHGREEYFFRALYCWATRGYTEFNRERPRWRNAVKLARQIDFTRVPSKFLLGFVECSGLVDQQAMSSVYRSHLAAKSNLPQGYGLQLTEDKPFKRSSEARDHETKPTQKQQRVDSGTEAGPRSSSNHINWPTLAAPTQPRSLHSSAAAQDETLHGVNGTATPLNPEHQNPTSMTAVGTQCAKERSVLSSSTETFALHPKASGSSQEEVLHSPTREEQSKGMPRLRGVSNGVSQQEQPPSVTEPLCSKTAVQAAPRDHGPGLQSLQMPTYTCERNEAALTEVKNEEVLQVVKDEMEIVEV